MAKAKSKKTKGQEAWKAFITITINGALDVDMDLLSKDLEESPDDQDLQWLLDKTGNSLNEIQFECSEKLVEALADFQEKNPNEDIQEYDLENIGKEIGEEKFTSMLCEKCNEITYESWMKELYLEAAHFRNWRDGFGDIREIEDKKIREQWKALLKRNIGNGLATDFYTLEEFKEECEDNPRPKNDKEWENAYDKYIDEVVEDYYLELDDYPDKELHMKDSGLRTYDEANLPTQENLTQVAESMAEYKDMWWVTDFGKK